MYNNICYKNEFFKGYNYDVEKTEYYKEFDNVNLDAMLYRFGNLFALSISFVICLTLFYYSIEYLFE
jgi:hypothetical protein